MNFIFDKEHPDMAVHTCRLITQETQQVFDNHLVFKFIELPKFKKKETALKSRLDQWLFALGNMHNLKNIPISLRGDRVFERLFEVARIINLNKKDMTAYEYASNKAKEYNLG